MRYRWHTGSIAWLIQRITGVCLVLYVFVHLYFLSHINNPIKFQHLMDLMKSPVIKFFEVGLLTIIAWHSLNGIRVTLLESGLATRLHKPLFRIMVIIVGLICLLSAWVFIGGSI